MIHFLPNQPIVAAPLMCVAIQVASHNSDYSDMIRLLLANKPVNCLRQKLSRLSTKCYLKRQRLIYNTHTKGIWQLFIISLTASTKESHKRAAFHCLSQHGHTSLCISTSAFSQELYCFLFSHMFHTAYECCCSYILTVWLLLLFLTC